jgi:hypothetical protein
MRHGQVEPRPQLLTYPDSLGGRLSELAGLLDGPLAGLFRGVHVLPPFPSSGDRGFAPVSYEDIDPAFGSWADVERIAADHDVLLDLMINHISRQSPEFRDFERRGRESPCGDLFITLDRSGRTANLRPEDVARIFLHQAQCAVLDRDDRAHWCRRTDLDVIRNRGLVRADRPGRQSPVTRALVTSWLGYSLCMASGS